MTGIRGAIQRTGEDEHPVRIKSSQSELRNSVIILFCVQAGTRPRAQTPSHSNANLQESMVSSSATTSGCKLEQSAISDEMVDSDTRSHCGALSRRAGSCATSPARMCASTNAANAGASTATSYDGSCFVVALFTQKNERCKGKITLNLCVNATGQLCIGMLGRMEKHRPHNRRRKDHTKRIALHQCLPRFKAVSMAKLPVVVFVLFGFFVVVWWRL